MFQVDVKPDRVEIHARGKLTREDYERLAPELERLARKRGTLNLYIELREFRGWSPAGLWDDLELDVALQDEMDRVAVVTDGVLEEWGVRLTKPFFRGEVRHFERREAKKARAWVSDGAGPG